MNLPVSSQRKIINGAAKFKNMKKTRILYILIFTVMLFLAPSFCFGQVIAVTDSISLNNNLHYKDGTYEGKSQSVYSAEPYWGIVRIKVKNGLFTEIDFTIRDSSLHETFNEKYEKHFEGIPEYIQQCRNDWKGVHTYPAKMSESQNIDKIDAMSGATWSCNIFKASVKEALKDAKK